MTTLFKPFRPGNTVVPDEFDSGPDGFDSGPDEFDSGPDGADTDPRRTVRRVYDRIAEHFAATRAYPWSDVEEFLDGREGDVGLAIGCGNGRHVELLAARVDRAVGIDASRGLLAEARSRARSRDFAVELLQGDAVALPVGSGTVNLALYVATIHHLPDRSTRIESLNELARVLTPSSVGLVSAWSSTHPRFDGADSGDVDDQPDAGDVDDRTVSGDVDDQRGERGEGHRREGFDTMVPWTLPDGTEVDRFYHIYAPEEFRADLAASDLSAEPFQSKGNCYAVVYP